MRTYTNRHLSKSSYTFLSFSLLLISLFSVSLQAGAQAKALGTLKGKLVDSLLQQDVKDATISVLNKEDSSLVAYGLTKQDGSFAVENIPFGDHFYQVSFTGYESIASAFAVTADKPLFDAGNLYLHQKSMILEEVLIKAAPILIKGDTTEFNAGSFKTIANATAEDLLKKLPGMEVDKDGSVKSQGETVTRILVDGKKFFGKDPKMATRNLPTDIIDKIQVFDAQNEESEFNGFDDGERIKTINIITKKDRKKGVFGKASIAGGDNGRYAAAVSANRFNGNQQVSFIAQTNNINNQNFSVQDFLGAMNTGNANAKSRGNGGSNVFQGDASGLAATRAAGINYNDVWGKKTTVNGSYFYNNVDATNNRDRYRETFVANDSSLFNLNQLLSENKNENHRFNFEIRHDFDSANSLFIQPDFNYQRNQSNSQTNSVTTKGTMKKLNDVQALGTTNNEGINFNNSIMFRHRFDKKGRSFSINFTNAVNTNDRYTTNYSISKRPRGLDTIDQVSSNIRDGKGWGTFLSYTEPVGKTAQLELSYRYNRSKNASDQQTYRREDPNGLYDVAVPNLTNKFENSNTSHRAGLSYRQQLGTLWNYSFGLGVQHATLTSNNLTKQTYLQQSFNNLFPTFNLQYRKSRYKNFRFIYRGRTEQPSVIQLQDVINNTNLLHIRSGNPSLLQEFNNSFSLRYSSFNTKTLSSFSANLNGGLIANKIANSTIINTSGDSMIIDDYKIIPGAQFTKPVNLDGAFDAGGNINYSFPVKTLGGMLHLASRLHYSRDVSLVNDEKSFIRDYILGGTVRLTMNLDERFDLNLSSNSTYDIVRYSQQADQNGDFFTQRFSAEPTYTTKSGWIFSNDFDYTMYRGQAEGFNQSVPLWNAGIAKLFLKKQQAELRFSVFDLLNQNKSISRNAEQNYVEDIRTQVLNRYFLLSFTYHLRSFKGVKNAARTNSKNVNQPFRQNRNRRN